MDTIVTVMFWIFAVAVATGGAYAYGRGWRAVADALAAPPRRPPHEPASHAEPAAQPTEAAV